MSDREEKSIVLMDFSGIYRQEQFYRGAEVSWVDVLALPGSNCYCDAEACGILREKIREFPVEGIHFLDSGNYHYMSRLWLEKMQEPFRLLVFDNHTDMQPPAFGGLLSCGGWLLSAMEELPFLREVYLAGPDEEAFGHVEASLKKNIHFLSQETLRKGSAQSSREFFEKIPADLPLYISVDKDILCPEDARTAWSQGDLRAWQLLEYLKSAGAAVGMDVCGECALDHAADSAGNDAVNRALLEFFCFGSGEMEKTPYEK